MKDLSLSDELAEYELAMAYLESHILQLRQGQLDEYSHTQVNDRILVPLRRVMGRIIEKTEANEAYPFRAGEHRPRRRSAGVQPPPRPHE